MAEAVRFENVTKHYPRGTYASLRQDIVDGARGMFGGKRRDRERGVPALRNLSFEIGEGESVSIVGPNGAGKTTALKLISRISYPTSGRVLVRGRVGALIEVHAGIHPELTGRENISLYGRIFGMSKSDIRRRFDSIIEFAELEKFIDVPVKRYSSGMQLRLGFSIASHLDPEVFVVDEALSVGDASFQMKCVARMNELLRDGRSLIFVSHDLHLVESVCPRAILIYDGQIAEDGPTKDVLKHYMDWIESRQLASKLDTHSTEDVRVTRVVCRDLAGNERTDFTAEGGLEIAIDFESDQPIYRPHVSLGVGDPMRDIVFECGMDVDGGAPEQVGTEWSVTCRLEELPLRPRVYEIYCAVGGEHGGEGLFDWKSIGAFRIVGQGEGVRGVTRVRGIAAVHLPYRWIVDPGLPTAAEPSENGAHPVSAPRSKLDPRA